MNYTSVSCKIWHHQLYFSMVLLVNFSGIIISNDNCYTVAKLILRQHGDIKGVG